MSLGERLYNLRKNKNLSQEQVAEQLNVTRQTVSKWETDESKPDFDKLVPICNLYDITPDELLTGNKVESSEQNTQEKTDNRKKKAKFILSGILCYFFAVIFTVLSEETFEFNEGITVALFLFMIAIGTCLIVYQAVAYSSFKERKVKNKKLKLIRQITFGVFAVIYFLVSFLTMAWHITWIIWIISVVVCRIIKLVFEMKGSEVDE